LVHYLCKFTKNSINLSLIITKEKVKKGILLLGLVATLFCSSCQEKIEDTSSVSVEMSQHTYRILFSVPQTSGLHHWTSGYSSIINRGGDIYELILSHYLWYPSTSGPKYWENKGLEKKYNGENGKSFDCKIATEDDGVKYISTTVYGYPFKGEYGSGDLMLYTPDGQYEEIYSLHLIKLYELEYDSSLDDLYKESIGRL